jgi:hypothetical protein
MGILNSRAAGLVVSLLILVGCAPTQSVSTQRLIRHQAMIDFSGLAMAEPIDELKISCALPEYWTALQTHRRGIYTHQQWKSESGSTGMGVAYIRTPIPLSANTFVWLAKKEYVKNDKAGRLLDQWTDKIGRVWFEAENEKFHVKGYAVTKGRDAWIIYSGFRITESPQPDEIVLAERSIETIIPLAMMTPVSESSSSMKE